MSSTSSLPIKEMVRSNKNKFITNIICSVGFKDGGFIETYLHCTADELRKVQKNIKIADILEPLHEIVLLIDNIQDRESALEDMESARKVMETNMVEKLKNFEKLKQLINNVWTVNQKKQEKLLTQTRKNILAELTKKQEMLRMTMELANTYTDTIAHSPDKEGKIFELQSRTNKLKTDMQTAFFQPNVNMRIEKIPEKTTASPGKTTASPEKSITALLDVSKLGLETGLLTPPERKPARRSSPLSPGTRVTEQNTKIFEDTVDFYDSKYGTNFEQQEMAYAIAEVSRRLIRKDNQLYPKLHTSGHNLSSLYSVERIPEADAKSLQRLHDLSCEYEGIDPDGLNSCIELLKAERSRANRRQQQRTGRRQSIVMEGRGGRGGGSGGGKGSGRLRIL